MYSCYNIENLCGVCYRHKNDQWVKMSIQQGRK